jgi:rhamnosyltransferase
LRAAFFNRVQSFFAAHSRELSELHYHDWAIYALSRSWGLTWCFDAQPRVDYRQHERNDTGVRFSRGGIARRLRLIKSGWYRKQMTVIARIASLAAPGNRRIAHWTSLLVRPVSVNRQLRIAAICLLDGRRHLLDRLLITTAALAGWV